MAYVAPSTLPTGTLVTSTHWAVQVNNDKFFHGPPTARVRATTNSTLSNAAWNAVPFTVEDWDTDTIWSSTSNRKLIARTAGKYLVNFSAGFTGSSAGSNRGIAIQKNTTTAGSGHEVSLNDPSTVIGPASYRMAVSQLVALTTGQFIRGEMFQDSGAGLQTSTVAGEQPMLSMIWMSS